MIPSTNNLNHNIWKKQLQELKALIIAYCLQLQLTITIYLQRIYLFKPQEGMQKLPSQGKPGINVTSISRK